jgi:hypothetical protein
MARRYGPAIREFRKTRPQRFKSSLSDPLISLRSSHKCPSLRCFVRLQIPWCREFSSVFFWSPTRISAESAHNREILPGPQGMEQGITGICYLTAYLSRTYSRFSAFSPASCRELTANPGFAVTPKNETGENIPIYREWRVDEEISALDDGTEAPGSGADGSGQA